MRADAHEVSSIRERLAGSNDSDVLATGLSRGEVLLTNDKDFGEMVVRDGEASAGVILLRLPRMSPDERAERIVAWLRVHGSDSQGSFVVLSPETHRIRRLTPPKS